MDGDFPTLKLPGASALPERLDGLDRASAAAAKIAWFRAVFRGREDVYARRFASTQTGRVGYQPVCGNEWLHGVCEKPRIRCRECACQQFLPVSDEVLRWHLSGADERGREFVMGIYPMLLDERCWLLVADFDGDQWCVPLPVDAPWKKDHAASVRRLIHDGVDRPLAQLFVHATPRPIPGPRV